jgi:hypothetical protein
MLEQIPGDKNSHSVGDRAGHQVSRKKVGR